MALGAVESSRDFDDRTGRKFHAARHSRLRVIADSSIA